MIIVLKIHQKIVNVNFKLFSIAIKNLIDNAIKYSNDKKVEVLTQMKIFYL